MTALLALHQHCPPGEMSVVCVTDPRKDLPDRLPTNGGPPVGMARCRGTLAQIVAELDRFSHGI